MADGIPAQTFWIVTQFANRPIVVPGLGGVLEVIRSPRLRPATYIDAARGTDLTVARLDLTNSNVSYMQMLSSPEGQPLMEGVLFRYVRASVVSYRDGTRLVEGVWANEYGAVTAANIYEWESEWSRGLAGRFLVGSADAGNLWRIHRLEADHLGRRIFVLRPENSELPVKLQAASTEKVNGSKLHPDRTGSPATQDEGFAYDVAISFAGEQRSEAQVIAACLRDSGLKVFYDEYEQATLWGRDLYEHLARVYQHEARYCLMLVSAAYAAKVWTTHERRSAQARALTERAEYILPVRFDDTEIPGLLPTIGHVRFQDRGIEGICRLVLEKLRSGSGPARVNATRKESLASSRLACLFDTERNIQAFIPVIECDWGNAEATFVFEPDDQSDGPYLDGLRGIRSRLLIAFRNNAAECRVEEVRHSVKGATEQWMVRARIENSDFTPSMEMSFGGLSADEIAEQRARRILLNEYEAGSPTHVNDTVRESFLRGMNTTLKVTGSPLPALYTQYGTTPARFLEVAWINAVMTLKASGVVIEITTLELALDGSDLHINFAGKRRKQYTNKPATTIAVTGICKLI